MGFLPDSKEAYGFFSPSPVSNAIGWILSLMFVFGLVLLIVGLVWKYA